MMVQGVISSENEAPYVQRAGGTRVVKALAAVVIVISIGSAGVLDDLAASAIYLLLPLVIVFVLLAWLVRLIPGMTFLGGGLFTLALQGRSRTATPQAPGRQVIVECADGRTEELLVAHPRRWLAGRQTTAWGPRLFGRRQVWVAQVSGMGPVVARGVPSAVFWAGLAFLTFVLSMIGAL